MLTRIGARGYRCFSHLDVALRPYAVLAGANGTGKSTLLDIPVLVGDMATGGVQRGFLETLREGQVPRAQSFREVFHRGRTRECAIILEAELPEEQRSLLASAAPPRLQANLPSILRYELQLRSDAAETILFVEAEYLDLVPPDARAATLTRVEDPQAAGWRTVIERLPEAPPVIRAEFRRGQQPSAELSPDRLALSQVSDRLLFPATTWFNKFLLNGTVHYAPDCAKLRQARPASVTNDLRADAANLPWQVLHLQREDPDRMAEWVAMVRLALPNVRRIAAIEREEDRHAYLKIDYAYGNNGDAADYAVTSSGLSDGTLRILAFSILPYLERLPDLLTIEQPEDGIHPRAIDVVLESLSALPDTQVFVSTHSPVVLARTPIENLVCTRRDDEGAAEAVNGPNHPRLQKWQQEIDLGSLFAAGVLA